MKKEYAVMCSKTTRQIQIGEIGILFCIKKRIVLVSLKKILLGERSLKTGFMSKAGIIMEKLSI